jgi:hypothetical protein
VWRRKCGAEDPGEQERWHGRDRDAFKDEDFAMLPQCGEGVRHGQHDHMIIGRNEIGVQHMIKVFAQELGVALS